MQFTIVAALFASVAMAAPATLHARATVCPTGLLYGVAQCCATSVLGVADLDCSVPSSTPSDGADLKRICAESGAAAMCCSIPLAGQGVLCTPVIG
ncbi:hypothetical protein VD0002_g2885 [Verticillium dahliae]|uniref:Hydrophobin n=2 Tax=Verticillium dahliae TaxID=27337 RepID=G2XFX7_VERDV|nr:uncharacterized protein VDAG_08956 [Verticillium dahliae VdLs.17]KAF3350466.1 hypothetical protein VdG2_01465 [Verticillium dahliae VDG2]KAH6702495.1 fungal hydrophobin-domain-containing protein [Verticillium dahliae]EGY18796.1 hypothetical protein VDAG_08956 [Verticillium dahliae VdLs.17]PNH36370.1 hypothetical protein BJF96_g188 [Verticillium dahliae]PNH52328.1 hypothetical protein VD0003_g4955 [Verticillium dahliae]